MSEERISRARKEIREILADHGIQASKGMLSDLVEYELRPLDLEITMEPLEITIDKDGSGTWNPRLPLKDGNSIELSRMTTFTVSMQASIKEKRSDVSEGSEGEDGLICCPADRGKSYKSYRKLPVEIAAKQMDQSFLIKTLAGTMYGHAGDYLVKGIHTELYPVAADIFTETYESLQKENSSPERIIKICDQAMEKLEERRADIERMEHFRRRKLDIKLGKQAEQKENSDEES